MYENFIQQHPFWCCWLLVRDIIIIFCGVLDVNNNSWLTHTHFKRKYCKKKYKTHTIYAHTVNKLNVRRVNHNINYMMIMF